MKIPNQHNPLTVYESIHIAIYLLRYIPLVRDIIQNIHEEFSYIPFYYLRKRVKALSVAGAEAIDNIGACVFQALFTNEDLAKYKFKGDIFYE